MRQTVPFGSKIDRSVVYDGNGLIVKRSYTT
jgi:hypothetical protein